MKKISLFMLMIFGVFMLFAADVPNDEVKEEVKSEVPTEVQPTEAQSAEVQSAETPAQEQKPAEVQPAEVPVNAPQPYVYDRGQQVIYYRPYVGVGIPLIVIGSVSFTVLMPAMATMAFASSDACEGKDWDFCEELYYNNKKHHTAWTVGSVMTGVVGAGMVVVGSWLTSVKKPKELPVEVSGFSLLPSKNGMYASLGFKF